MVRKKSFVQYELYKNIDRISTKERRLVVNTKAFKDQEF
jgi:hypothetical protein